jgi:hypothetical protein
MSVPWRNPAVHRLLLRANTTSRYIPVMERQYELEFLRRSIAMLTVGAPGLDREAAMVLVMELQGLERQVRQLPQWNAVSAR